MALTDAQSAWVNTSNIIIPVYDQVGNFGLGHTTAGGKQIGSIYPGEFYTTRVRGNNLTYHEIRFRKSGGSIATGYIETLPQGHTWPEAAWVSLQEPYNYYNSNGSSLVKKSAQSLNGTSGYYVFTVKKAVRCVDPNNNFVATIPVGDKLAARDALTGSSNSGYMRFYLWNRQADGSQFRSICSAGYGFVDLGLNLGSEPSTRAIW